MKETRQLKINLDSLGFSASFICAVHCAAMPLLLTALAASPLRFLISPFFEISIILLSLIIGVSSLLPGYLKYHKKLLPIILLLCGFVIIFSGHFIFPLKLESVITPIGALTVAFSHILNWKFSKNFNSCNANHD